MEFQEFNQRVREQFARMTTTGKLFKVNVPGQEVWDLYLASFVEENKFRDPDSSEHNCNCCKNFLRRYGNIVAVIDGKLESLFSNLGEVGEYTPSSKAVDKLVTSSEIRDVFFETHESLLDLKYNTECIDEKGKYHLPKTLSNYNLGIESNLKQYSKEEAKLFGVVNTETVYEFHHFSIDLPKQFVDFSGKSIDAIMAFYRDKYSVFKRAMEEITLNTFTLVKDLINQGSLLDGTAHLYAIDNIIPYAKMRIGTGINNNQYWQISYSLEERVTKFRNTAIGRLCKELAEGKELNEACKMWNKMVDPVNYMKATAPITQKQIDAANKFVVENDYVESFNRRLVSIDDIRADEIKYMDETGETKGVSMFDSVKATKTTDKKPDFSKVEEISIEKFMKDILPSCTSVEAYFENRMENNLCVLTKAIEDSSKSIFKWDNNYSWTFNGNLAGKSQLSDMVQAKGGRVDGVFRFTHSWNKLERNESLMDLHVFMPGCSIPKTGHHGPSVRGRYVGWNNRKDTSSGGNQDVDYTDIAPVGHIPVENITFPNINKMPEGKYTCAINNWSFRTSGGKGEAEIALLGSNIYEYVYPATKKDEWIIVAEVTLKDGQFSIDHKLSEKNLSKEIWNIDTNKFHKVNLVCNSPNHWGDNKFGNLHYMFMLEDCKTATSVRGFHNENLIQELLDHRKVLEVLGTTNMIEPTENHLAGLGFNATVKDELVVKCSGSFNRMLKIKF